ncbi:LysR family transcriptional regulator [Pseudonocardia sp. RS11V-5]|uniref:LysR family transcriptional regulator n=1 Tax=Pseudonocardia terrae TaxID=2905831 RepID=UPI001E2D3BCE|nr:LysR family transcriptional regulator [Pseudonocardia terrae]MCE3556034.1 LysR family transcriptional regulator [Pseudonocardia terrae]
MAERLSTEALRHARAVARSGSFSAAAREQGVSQPALSTAIAKLEERLGGRLFDRSPRGVTPTAFGTQILPLVERALAGLDAVPIEARRILESGSTRIRMGVSPLIKAALVTRAFAAVRDLPTPRELVLREADMADLQAGLLAGELDVILVPSVGPLPGLEHRIIDSEPIVVVGSRERTPVELAEAADDEFILVPDSCGLTRFTSQLFDAHELPLRTYAGEAASYQVLEQWADLGLGAAILPLSKLTSPDARHRVLHENGQEVEIFYEAAWHPGSPLAPELGRLVHTLAETAGGEPRRPDSSVSSRLP